MRPVESRCDGDELIRRESEREGRGGEEGRKMKSVSRPQEKDEWSNNFLIGTCE